jgi:hypothetical protein
MIGTEYCSCSYVRCDTQDEINRYYTTSDRYYISCSKIGGIITQGVAAVGGKRVRVLASMTSE